MEKMGYEPNVQRVFCILRKALTRKGKSSYLVPYEKQHALLFHKFCLEVECYEDIYEIPLAKAKITSYNHSIVTLMTNYCTSEEMVEIRKLVSGIYSFVLLEKQTQAINNALISDGAETFKYQERFKSILSLMQTTAFWSLFKSPTTAAEVIDLVFSEKFVDDFFSTILNQDEDDRPEVANFIKAFIKKLFSTSNISNTLNTFSLITFPAIVKTTQIDVYNIVKDYVREIFQKSEYLKTVEEYTRKNQKTKTIHYKPVIVIESDDPTLCSDLNISQIVSLYKTHSTKMPVVIQKLSLYTIVVFNSFKSFMITKKNGTLLYEWGVIEDVESKKIIPLDYEKIKDFGRRCNIDMDDEIIVKIKNSWMLYWDGITNKGTHNVTHIDAEVYAVIICAMLSKNFWEIVIRYAVSDENTVKFFSEKIEEFLQHIILKDLNNLKDFKSADADEMCEEAYEQIASFMSSSTERIKQLTVIISPFLKKVSPSFESVIHKVNEIEMLPKTFVKKVLRTFRSNYNK